MRYIGDMKVLVWEESSDEGYELGEGCTYQFLLDVQGPRYTGEIIQIRSDKVRLT